MTLYLRENIWWIDVTVQGERYRLSTEHGKKKAAKQFEKDFVRRVNGGEVLPYKPTKEPFSIKGLTLGDALDKALRTSWADHKDWSGYNGISKQLKQLVGGDVLLVNISSITITKLKEDLMASDLANATINRKMAVLSSLLNVAKDEWEMNITIPTFKLLPERNARTRVFTFEEEEKMLSWFRENKPEMEQLVVVLFDTGCRLSEALKLRGSNVTQSGYVRFERTKNGEGRGIPMTDRVKSILGTLAHDSEAFPTLTKNIACKAMQDFRESHYIEDPEWVLHTCRHTCATRLLEAGVDIYTVKEWLGHKSIETTLRYAKMTNIKLNHAKDLLEMRRINTSNLRIGKEKNT